MLGGRPGAIRYSIIFAIAGTAADFTAVKLEPVLRNYGESILGNDSSEKKDGWLKLPEWSPIQVLDEEAIAAKQAREQQLYAQRALGKLNKEESWKYLILYLELSCFNNNVFGACLPAVSKWLL